MTDKIPQKFKTIDFSEDEFKQVIERSKELISRGYFTGINLLQSETVLPDKSIIIHFLHDCRQHIEEIIDDIGTDYLVVPRFTYYRLKPEYFKKLNFTEEYGKAIFFNKDFEVVHIDEAIKNPENITVSNSELDLVIPVTNSINLGDFLRQLRKRDRLGSNPWIDPVIIVKTKSQIELLDKFVNNFYVCIARSNEEFYTVLTDEGRANALEKYLDKLCNRIRFGKIGRSDIVFHPSQINSEFADYLNTIQHQLKTAE